jgi:hypothetical protein
VWLDLIPNLDTTMLDRDVKQLSVGFAAIVIFAVMALSASANIA